MSGWVARSVCMLFTLARLFFMCMASLTRYCALLDVLGSCGGGWVYRTRTIDVHWCVLLSSFAQYRNDSNLDRSWRRSAKSNILSRFRTFRRHHKPLIAHAL